MADCEPLGTASKLIRNRKSRYDKIAALRGFCFPTIEHGAERRLKYNCPKFTRQYSDTSLDQIALINA